MAVATRIVSLNLGSQTIGLAEFQAQPNGGLVLGNYRLREIVSDAAGESMRYEQVASASREMLNELQIKADPVNYAVAGQSVFARFVKLPAVEEEKIERIISFEAQQNVPFPIDEVVWDYQLVGGGAEEIWIVERRPSKRNEVVCIGLDSCAFRERRPSQQKTHKKAGKGRPR